MLEAFNEKNKEKALLVNKLTEVCIVVLSSLNSLKSRLEEMKEASITAVMYSERCVDAFSIGLFLLQLVGESEKLRMKKLEELSKSL